MRRWQLARLRETLGQVQAHSPFYAERLRGIDGESILSFEDLARLPFTLPSDLTRDPLAFLCIPQSDVARVTTLTTSGSTGAKKRIFFSGNDLERTVDFFACGMRDLVREGQDTLILMGHDTEHSIARLLQTGLARIGVKGRIGLSTWKAQEALEAARTADCLVGLPAEILYLCRMDKNLRPESVLLSADFVPVCVIESLQARWHCKVFTHFGLTETGFGCAVQCTAGEGHHLRDADLLIEICDPETGRQLPPRMRGEIVITLLRNEAMPLLRYRTGDLSCLLPEPCACGGILPRLGRVEGRRENELLAGPGGTLSIHRLDELIFAQHEVRAYEAALDFEGRQATLCLTVEADGQLEQETLLANLPKGLALHVRYAGTSPFSNRAKRRIHTRNGIRREPVL